MKRGAGLAGNTPADRRRGLLCGCRRRQHAQQKSDASEHAKQIARHDHSLPQIRFPKLPEPDRTAAYGRRQARPIAPASPIGDTSEPRPFSRGASIVHWWVSELRQTFRPAEFRQGDSTCQSRVEAHTQRFGAKQLTPVIRRPSRGPTNIWISSQYGGLIRGCELPASVRGCQCFVVSAITPAALSCPYLYCASEAE